MAGVTGLARQWVDFIDICGSGFDTTGYACEILKRTVEWEIKSQWRIISPNEKSPAARSYGSTFVVRTKEGSSEPPFKIRICIGAELMWPLLADEYSSAEKAATTLFVAGTMLHEISVSLDLMLCPAAYNYRFLDYADLI